MGITWTGNGVANWRRFRVPLGQPVPGLTSRCRSRSCPNLDGRGPGRAALGPRRRRGAAHSIGTVGRHLAGVGQQGVLAMMAVMNVALSHRELLDRRCLGGRPGPRRARRGSGSRWRCSVTGSRTAATTRRRFGSGASSSRTTTHRRSTVASPERAVHRKLRRLITHVAVSGDNHCPRSRFQAHRHAGQPILPGSAQVPIPIRKEHNLPTLPGKGRCIRELRTGPSSSGI